MEEWNKLEKLVIGEIGLHNKRNTQYYRNMIVEKSPASCQLCSMQMLAASCEKESFPGFVSPSAYILFFNVNGHGVDAWYYGNTDYAIDNVEAVTF